MDLDSIDFEALAEVQAERQRQRDAEAAAVEADNDCGDACKI